MIDALVSALLIWAVGRITLRMMRDGVALRLPVRVIGKTARALRWSGLVFILWTLLTTVDPALASRTTRIWIDLGWALAWCPAILLWAWLAPRDEIFRPWIEAIERQNISVR